MTVWRQQPTLCLQREPCRQVATMRLVLIIHVLNKAFSPSDNNLTPNNNTDVFNSLVSSERQWQQGTLRNKSLKIVT